MAKVESTSVTSEATLVSRKRKLWEIMRNETDRISLYPIRLCSSGQNIDVASIFYEVWLDDNYQPDLLYCKGGQHIVTRDKRHNSNLIRHLKVCKHKSDSNLSSINQNEEGTPATMGALPLFQTERSGKFNSALPSSQIGKAQGSPEPSINQEVLKAHSSA